MSTPLLTMAQVAQRLGHTVEWFYRHQRRLIERENFPPSLASLGKRWHADAVDLWLKRQAGLAPTPSADAEGAAANDDTDAILRARLAAL